MADAPARRPRTASDRDGDRSIGVTRRELLAATAGAGLALGAAGALARAAPAEAADPLARRLLKCIAIGPEGARTPGAPADYRRLRLEPWWPALARTTSHIQIYADWVALQPVPDVDPWSPENPGFEAAAGLDEQVRLATDDGLQVILLPHAYPAWANGTAGIVPNSVEDVMFEPWNRLRWEVYEQWLQSPDGPAPARRQLYHRVPDEGHGSDTAWGRFVAALWDRYVGQAPMYGRVAYFDVVNEANYFPWPQRGPAPPPADPDADDLAVLKAKFEWVGSEMVVQRATAEMMLTMDELAHRHGLAAMCLAPSTADTNNDYPRVQSVIFPSPWATSFDPFVDRLLDELERVGFSGGDHWGWSFHNYADFEQRQTRVQLLRERITGRWNGRQLDGVPALYCDEGGCRLSAVRGRFGPGLSDPEQRRLQGEVIREALTRHRDTADGAGVAMLGQYTTYADPNFNCGLLEPWGAGGVARPALDVWSSIEEEAPPPDNPAP